MEITKENTESRKDSVALKNYSLNKISDLQSMSKVLKSYIVKNNLFTPIQGKNYVHADGWSFAGGMLGLSPRIVTVTNLSNDKEIKWYAEVEIVNNKTEKVVSRGFAICSTKETKKKSFDEYAILSMTQTRAVSKAFRSTIGYVLKLSGFEATPSEEMSVEADKKQASARQRPSKTTVGDGQVEGPDGDPVYVCSETGEIISAQEYEYSMRMFGRALCREAQKGKTKI